MKKRALLVFFIISFLLISNVYSYENKLTKTLEKTLEKDNSARVIIKFKESNSLTNFSKSQEINEKNIFAFLNKKQIDEISKNSNVEKIYGDYKVKAFLQDSITIVNASNSWNVKLNSINITGAGETICILDTGINYSHESLGGCYGNNNVSSNCKVIGGYDFVNNDDNAYDDNGHGTHVAGIISSNNQTRGIAPDSKVIAIKVLDASGNGYSSDLIKGMEWCIGNASLFNITVISMSLGTDCSSQPEYCYSSYCDSEDSLTSYVNEAVSKNISVIIASGNDGNSTAISSPACIENATAVAASDKNDVIASYSNRNSLIKLIAPGTSINSTLITGNYGLKSGTSMATPHVAAAFALIRQYKLLEKGTILTPNQIQSYLNNSGKIIHDSSSNLNFSRIDVYSTILSIDASSPEVYLSGINNSISTNLTQNFSCNSSDLQLKNITFNLFNSSYSYNETKTILGKFNSSSFNLTLNFGTYSWNCLSCDMNSNCNSSQNYSMTLTSLSVSQFSPENYSRRNSNYSVFFCNSSSQNSLKNITFNLFNSSYSYNETKNISGTNNLTEFNYTFLSEGEYFWNCLVSDTQNIVYSLTNYSFFYDSNSPTIFVSISNNSVLNSLNFNATSDEDLSSCWLIFNSSNFTFSQFNSSLFYYENSTIPDSNLSFYNLTVYCNDTAGNINSTAKIFFSVDKTLPEVTLISPEQGSYSSSIDFIFNATDNINLSYCYLTAEGSNSYLEYNSSKIENPNTISKSLSTGTYSWKITCRDIAGNEGNSSSRSITITQNTVQSSGGSSGSSRTSSTSSSTSEKTSIISLSSNNNFILTLSEKLEFFIKNEKHSLKIEKIIGKIASFVLNSSEIRFSLAQNQSIELDTNNNSKNDLYIKLNSLNNSANLTIREIQEINELINKTSEILSDVNDSYEIKPVTKQRKIFIDWKVTILVIILFLLIAILLRIKYAKKKRKRFEILFKGQ